MLVLYHSRQFAMSNGSYDSNLGSEILILAGDIRLRSWRNISWTYGNKALEIPLIWVGLRKVTVCYIIDQQNYMLIFFQKIN